MSGVTLNSAAVSELIKDTLRPILAPSHVVRVDAEPGRDMDDADAVYAVVAYSGPAPRGEAMLEATVDVQTAMRNEGDERFVYMTFESVDDQDETPE